MLIIQAHRGAKCHYPENTFPAYYGAIEEHYSFIELDTKFTKDGVCVLIHDDTVNRTGRRADGSSFEKPVRVSDLTLAELKELDFGVFFSEKFRGTKIPELHELLDFVKKTNMEIKFDNVIETASESELETFFGAVSDSGVECRVGICCQTLPFMKKVTEHLPHCILHYDGETSPEIYEKLGAIAEGHELTVWLPNEKKSWLPYPPATEGDILLAKKYGKVGLWTAHSLETLRQIVAMQPDALEIDDGITPEDVRGAERAFSEGKTVED